MSTFGPIEPGVSRRHGDGGKSRIGRVLFGGAAALCCAGLSIAVLASGYDPSPLAPNDPGVCWRADTSAANKPKYTVIADDAPNLASCAADVELAYLTERHPIMGAYQGYYIFSEPQAVTGSRRLNYIRYSIFNRAERALIDRRLRTFMQTRDSVPAEASEVGQR